MQQRNPNVGRVAQLVGLVSKAQLNESYVVVESYNASNDRLAIRTLAAAINPSVTESFAVKLASLQFSDSETFASKYPNAPTQPGTFLINEYVAGTVIDFTSTRYENSIGGIPVKTLVPDFHLAFMSSCRVVGAPLVGSNGPMTLFPDFAGFSPENENGAIIEVVNIHFGAGVMCCTGNTTFRNCKFTSARGVRISTNVRALFENCLFENNSDFCVQLSETSHATILNCTFQCNLADGGQAVVTGEGCSAKVVHSTFVGMGHSVNAMAKTISVELLNCSFTNDTSVSVNIMNGSHCTAKGCRWQGSAEQAIKVEGPKRATLLVEDSVISECQMGVYAGHGKVDITVRNSEISRSTFHGIHLSADIIGTVEFIGCSITGSQRRDIANLCGVHCPVTINGVLQRQDDMHARLKAILPDMKELGDKDVAKNGPCRAPMKHLRSQENAGVSLIQCEYCQAREPFGVKFSICSKCKNVCYCSRDCQVTHWKASHKKECGTTAFG